MIALNPRKLDAACDWRVLALCIVFCGMFYGAVMGMYFEIGGPRALQMLYSALKVPMLLGVTFVITIPSFFVINTLLGLRGDFAESIRALMATQAILAVVLASFAPFTALWYASSASYDGAQLFNLMMFGLASFAAQFWLRKMYRPLIARSPRHRTMLGAWLMVYAFVGVQMAWVLRPFIGAPNHPTQFFREDAWSNAYVVVFRLLWRAVRGDC